MTTAGNPPPAGRHRRPQDAAGGQPWPPEYVIVPAHPLPPGEEGDLVFETRQDQASGVTVLPVFSTVPRLVQALGHAQPWVAMPLVSIREQAGSAGVREVRLDPSAAPGAWRWDKEELARLEGSLQ
jgi:hypothetical protein